MEKKLQDKGKSDTQIEQILEEQRKELERQEEIYNRLNNAQNIRRQNLNNAGITPEQVNNLSTIGTSNATQQGNSSLRDQFKQFRTNYSTQLSENRKNFKGDISENFSGMGTQLSGAISSSLSTIISGALVGAITTAFTGGDVKEAIINSGKAALVAAIPTLISSVVSIIIPHLTAAISTIVGALGGPILLAVAALVAVIGFAVWESANGNLKAAEKIKKQADQNYEEAKNRYTKMSEYANQKQDEAKESTKRLKNLSEEINRYEELNRISYKTEEQQQEYNSLIEDLKNELPELDKFYDERNNQLTISNNKLEEMLQKEKELSRQTLAQSNAAQMAQLQAQKAVIRASNESKIAQIDVDEETFKRYRNLCGRIQRMLTSSCITIEKKIEQK